MADPLSGLVGFARTLRHAGLAADPQRVQAYTSAVEHLDLSSPVDLYWAGRLTLCSEPDDLVRYDAAFAAWFGRLVTTGGPDRPVIPQPLRSRMASLVNPPDGKEGGEADDDELRVFASDVEVLHHRDIAELTVAERDHLRQLMTTLRLDPPRRRALRSKPSRRGRLDASRTVRAMLATGGEPARLRHVRRGDRPRRVVLLIDVSGSMSPYADALLRFAHAVARRSPGSTEVFTVGTRLTRVSRQLRLRDPEAALAAAGRAVPDFHGGTRLGETLRAFLDRWGQRGIARQSVVVLFSDVWERGDTDLLAEQMARLRRLARAVFWVNPHAGRQGYAPVQSGIAAALPHVDLLLAGHSLATLRRLWSHVLNSAAPAGSVRTEVPHA
ncbi:VWA domain-containing protein [Fodinicola feengrottensis]|uniref:VWA domain-containing protein n=1 Tax=Fodinicola feengrottensis TaxID=435914 RepID=A0ABN2GY37_9ACTN